MSEQDDRWVEQVSYEWHQEAQRAGVSDWRELSSGILLHVAARTPRATEPVQYPPSNPEPGKVSFRVEAWPHDPGANGEEYVSGHLRANEVASWLREIADRCERYWADPECPWPEEHGQPVKPISEKQLRAEEAKRAAYEAQRAAEMSGHLSVVVRDVMARNGGTGIVTEPDR